MVNETATFEQLFEKHFKQLNLYTIAITRAHGKSHPVTFEIRELFSAINDKMQDADAKTPDLTDEFIHLRLATNHYLVPEDVCGTYITVYETLSQLDEAYMKGA